jgi:hypothetical protein
MRELEEYPMHAGRSQTSAHPLEINKESDHEQEIRGLDGMYRADLSRWKFAISKSRKNQPISSKQIKMAKSKNLNKKATKAATNSFPDSGNGQKRVIPRNPQSPSPDSVSDQKEGAVPAEYSKNWLPEQCESVQVTYDMEVDSLPAGFIEIPTEKDGDCL